MADLLQDQPHLTERPISTWKVSDMPSQYKIIIKNMSGQTVSFYAFQKQATFVNSGADPNVISSSLACGALAPFASSGAQLDFSFDAQTYVGAKTNAVSESPALFNATISLASTKSTVAGASAVQPIDLTTSSPSQSVNNFSNLQISPFGLSAPQYQPGLSAGSFGVQSPPYSAGPSTTLYCGCAAINQDGSITLSSYITPLPNSQLYCSPVAIYYATVGSAPVGQVITYNTGQAAECDFTSGYSAIRVQYNNDGTFSKTGS